MECVHCVQEACFRGPICPPLPSRGSWLIEAESPSLYIRITPARVVFQPGPLPKCGKYRRMMCSERARGAKLKP